MKARIFICLTIISVIFAKNLRFLDTAADVMSDASKMVSLIEAASSTGMNAMMGHVGMIVDGLATIVTTFKNSYSKKLVDEKKGVGFKDLVGSVEFDFNVGYREKGYDFWMEELLQQFYVPKDYYEDFCYSLAIGKYAEEDSLFDNSFVFNKTDPNDKTKNTVTYLNFLIYHYDDKNRKKFNAIITSGEAYIKLFPDKLIYQESKSIAGGIKETNKMISEWRNRDLTTKDVDQVVSILKACTYRTLADLLGIKYRDYS